jgi:hypothetical protein
VTDGARKPVVRQGLICPNKNPLDAFTAAGAVEHFMGTGDFGHADGFRTTEVRVGFASACHTSSSSSG